MPQFDQFSFFTQVFWFLLLFFIFYFLLTYFYIPKICYNLKFRQKKIKFNSIYENKINFEKNNINVIFNTINKKFFFNFNFLINKKFLISQYIIKLFNNFLLNNSVKKNIKSFLKFDFILLRNF